MDESGRIDCTPAVPQPRRQRLMQPGDRAPAGCAQLVFLALISSRNRTSIRHRICYAVLVSLKGDNFDQTHR
jgi:hypothetical protein